MIANPSLDAVNLHNWRLLDGHNEQHVIVEDVWVAPGGVHVDGVYTGLQLADDGIVKRGIECPRNRDLKRFSRTLCEEEVMR